MLMIFSKFFDIFCYKSLIDNAGNFYVGSSVSGK